MSNYVRLDTRTAYYQTSDRQHTLVRLQTHEIYPFNNLIMCGYFIVFQQEVLTCHEINKCWLRNNSKYSRVTMTSQTRVKHVIISYNDLKQQFRTFYFIPMFTARQHYPAYCNHSRVYHTCNNVISTQPRNLQSVAQLSEHLSSLTEQLFSGLSVTGVYNTRRHETPP